MSLALIAFLAGILTILAPCVIPVLPVIIGGSLADKKSSWKRAALIVGSLAISIIVFTLLLKATTSLLSVPQVVWQVISGTVVLVLGLFYLFPTLWDTIAIRSGLGLRSQQALAGASGSGKYSAVLTGVALGPVFSSCSPTYAFIVAAVLPVSFVEGFLYLVLYALGLGASLFSVAFGGQRLVKRLGWALNPHGLFRQIVGILFVLIGVMILIGGDKVLQEAVLESGLYDPIESIENNLRK